MVQSIVIQYINSTTSDHKYTTSSKLTTFPKGIKLLTPCLMFLVIVDFTSTFIQIFWLKMKADYITINHWKMSSNNSLAAGSPSALVSNSHKINEKKQLNLLLPML